MQPSGFAEVQEPLLAMAFTRQKVQQVIESLEDPINTHVIKLLAFEATALDRGHWQHELKAWFRKISVLRIKPDMRSPSEAWLYDLLYEGPFGGVELQNVRSTMGLLAREGYVRNGASAEAVLERIQAFYAAMPARLAVGDPAFELIEAL